MSPAVNEVKPRPSCLRRFLILFSLAGFFLPATSVPGQSYTWRNVVIKGGGFVSGLITHPNAPGVVYARTDIGGAYRWNAAGNAWVPLLDFGAGRQYLRHRELCD